ncbi:hypothetical protein QN366_04950 [Pseudomonas sp. CCC3.2]|uniref:hypothetical protein n=1 Tax=unclassified Pseudomonas TaxID=196821 RepID=UPI002AB59AC3|nr:MULTISPECIES: hypothetical protein [unclassified Pseudomonas]MDY7559938.1 hypothetical protein [Pseudomonas sp. AB6]MEB0179422.1 hypothetical protein [Pseudomonas sp. CCC3.2]MEB0210488.1 hypothetical protein [Pseudomonas sp. AB6]
MSESKMREEFEAWSANHEYLDGVEIDRAVSGNYSDVDLHHAWEAWQASRESLVIELPEIWDFGPSEGYEHATLIECLKSQGLKVSK